MIEGKVAQVLNTRELAINRGRKDGVKVGMKFAVLAETPLELKDPETGAVLGVIDREKVRVSATEVHDAFAICRTYETRSIPAQGVRGITEILGLGWAQMGPYQPEREVPVTLRANDSALPPPLSHEESYVKPKDRVREISDT